MRGLEKGQAIAWYHYYWYYGTLAMHQMGGRYWRALEREDPPHVPREPAAQSRRSSSARGTRTPRCSTAAGSSARPCPSWPRDLLPVLAAARRRRQIGAGARTSVCMGARCALAGGAALNRWAEGARRRAPDRHRQPGDSASQACRSSASSGEPPYPARRSTVSAALPDLGSTRAAGWVRIAGADARDCRCRCRSSLPAPPPGGTRRSPRPSG